MAEVVGEPVALAERAVDPAAGYAADVAPWAGAGAGAVALVAGGLAGVAVGLIGVWEVRC